MTCLSFHGTIFLSVFCFKYYFARYKYVVVGKLVSQLTLWLSVYLYREDVW
jgi:hypothetical protein